MHRWARLAARLLATRVTDYLAKCWGRLGVDLQRPHLLAHPKRRLCTIWHKSVSNITCVNGSSWLHSSESLSKQFTTFSIFHKDHKKSLNKCCFLYLLPLTGNFYWRRGWGWGGHSFLKKRQFQKTIGFQIYSIPCYFFCLFVYFVYYTFCIFCKCCISYILYIL